MPGRFPGTKARFSGRTWSSQVGRDLDELLGKIFDAVKLLQLFPGLPKTIEAGLAADTGVGPAPAMWDHQHPVLIATPSHPTGPVALEGSGAALMRADATIQQGIVTTKGDLLGFSTVPVRIPVGADGAPLRADSTAAPGVSYSASVKTFDAVAADSSTQFLSVAGTLPAIPTAPVSGMTVAVTGAGSAAFTQVGVSVALNTGYAGASASIGALVGNTSVATGLNYGIYATLLPPAPSGTQIGAFFQAASPNPAKYAIGVMGQANQGVAGSAGATSIGVLGNASSGGRRIGGYFSPNTSTAPVMPLVTDVVGDACIILNRGGIAADSIQAMNGTAVEFVVAYGGGLRVKSAALGAVTLDNTNHVIRVDTSAGPVTITLPPIAAGNRGVWYRFKNEGANALTIARTGADTIDGAATQVLTAQYQSVDIICPEAGTDWVSFGASLGVAGSSGLSATDLEYLAWVA